MYAVRFVVLSAVMSALTLWGADAPPADAKATAPAAPKVVTPAPGAPAAPAAPGAAKPTDERMKAPTNAPAKAKEPLPPPVPAVERPAPRTADAQSEAAVSAYIKAVGGIGAFAAIQDRYERFNVIRHSPTGGTTAVFERYLKRGNMVREDWHMAVPVGETPSLDVVQTYNPKTGKGYAKMMGYVSEIDAKMIYMLVWDKYIDDALVCWKQDGYALKYRGEGEVQKRPCHVVDVFPPLGGSETRYFFDKENGLLLKKQWRTDVAQEGPVRNELFFAEYRKVKDLKDPTRAIQFAFRQDQQENGDLIMSREYIEIKLNSGISDDLFDRPPGPEYQGPVGQNDSKEKGVEKKKEDDPPWKKDRKRIVPKGGGTEGAPKAPDAKAPAAPGTPAPSAPAPSAPAPSTPAPTQPDKK